MHDQTGQSNCEQDAPTGTLVHCLLHRARTCPDKTAFLNPQRSIDYQSLLHQACQVAAALIDHGIGAGDKVAVVLPRCLEVPIAVYGVWLSGAAYVPIDPAANSADQASMMAHCDVAGLITQAQLHSKLSPVLNDLGDSIQLVVGLESNSVQPSMTWSQVQQLSTQRAWPQIDPYSLAYILHTSGSTGKPKGIMHSHASALAYTQLTVQACSVNSTDVIACHSALHTDMSTLGLFAAPFTGASAVIVPDAYIRMPASLSTLLQDTKVSIWYSVPLALVHLLQHGVLHNRDCTSLRLVIYAGEAMSPVYLKQLLLIWPHTRISNHYGPAETNVCTYFDLPADAIESGYLETGLSIPIGKPWGTNTIKLLDDNLNPAATGESGEIFVSSATTMMGYWKEPTLSSETLINVESQDENKLYYKTGDIAEYDSNGDLRLIGRKDRQVKVRGYRVELDAIELLLSDCKQIKQNAVFTVKNDDSLQIHIAVVPVSADVTETDIAQYCKQVIYQRDLPLTIELMDKFPTTSSGKIDRRGLADQISEHGTI